MSLLFSKVSSLVDLTCNFWTLRLDGAMGKHNRNANPVLRILHLKQFHYSQPKKRTEEVNKEYRLCTASSDQQNKKMQLESSRKHKDVAEARFTRVYWKTTLRTEILNHIGFVLNTTEVQGQQRSLNCIIRWSAQDQFCLRCLWARTDKDL